MAFRLKWSKSHCMFSCLVATSGHHVDFRKAMARLQPQVRVLLMLLAALIDWRDAGLQERGANLVLTSFRPADGSNYYADIIRRRPSSLVSRASS